MSSKFSAEWIRATSLTLALSISSVVDLPLSFAQDLPSRTCLLSPEVTEGPYYVGNTPDRKDITEEQAGVPMTLNLRVVDASTCEPLPGVTVEVWHPNALGVYSGIPSLGTEAETFLRGQQLTNQDGVAQFQTIYPGWYPGRTVHVHFKVDSGDSTLLTSQLFFDDKLSDQIFQLEPYSTHPGNRIRNTQDRIKIQSDPNDYLVVDTTRANDSVTGNITIGVTR